MLTRGFTLIEAIIALSLVVIVTLLVVPSFRRQTNEVTQSLAQTQLLRQLQHAQQAANARMVSVVVCLSRDGKTCATKDGTMILVFVDSHADGAIHEESQRINSTFLKGEGLLRLRAYPNYRNYLLVLPTIVSKSDNGTFWYCKDHAVEWAVSVSQSGEPHSVTTPDDQLEC